MSAFDLCSGPRNCDKHVRATTQFLYLFLLWPSLRPDPTPAWVGPTREDPCKTPYNLLEDENSVDVLLNVYRNVPLPLLYPESPALA